MELLSPAGNIEKLSYAYRYGADAAYIGVKSFSLRARADNFHSDEHEEIRRIKGEKKLYCAINIYFHNQDLRRLEEELDYLARYPFDAFIVSDPGIIGLLRRRFPDRPLHLSTQANCVNSESVKFYRDAGFSRIILGREVSLTEIDAMRREVPDVELEAFVHGAMCLAYSGRCFLSAWMVGRTANQGDCSHSCRWKYRLVTDGLAIEEEKRPGEYYPVVEGDGFTTILSSRDICMIDHLRQLRDAGIDSVKIEGRMKSIYYAAVVTRAYRKQLDHILGRGVTADEAARYVSDLYRVSHREYSTGFFFGREEADRTTERSYQQNHRFLGIIGARRETDTFNLLMKNQILTGAPLEVIGPDIPHLTVSDYRIFDSDGNRVDKADHGKSYTIQTTAPVEEGFLIRSTVEEP